MPDTIVLTPKIKI